MHNDRFTDSNEIQMQGKQKILKTKSLVDGIILTLDLIDVIYFT